jgi:hypothetical protein
MSSKTFEIVDSLRKPDSSVPETSTGRFRVMVGNRMRSFKTREAAEKAANERDRSALSLQEEKNDFLKKMLSAD